MDRFEAGDLVIHMFDPLIRGVFEFYDDSHTFSFITLENGNNEFGVFPQNLILDDQRIRETKIKTLLCQEK